MRLVGVWLVLHSQMTQAACHVPLFLAFSLRKCPLYSRPNQGLLHVRERTPTGGHLPLSRSLSPGGAGAMVARIGPKPPGGDRVAGGEIEPQVVDPLNRTLKDDRTRDSAG